jgi:uncharacterized membrane protein YgcG
MSNPRIEVDFAVNVAGVANGVSAATSQLDKLGKAAQATAPKVEQLGKATSRYNGIGIDFARVIQDAPFGIIGVGNNIQQLAQSFSSLGNAGDSTISKLKTAFSAIFSSGNLLILGVSALTTALTYLSQKGFFDTEKAAKSLDDQLKEYQDTLGSIDKATLKGLQNSESEIQKFKNLTSQAENLNVSDKNRLAAVNELQKKYPEYLGNLTKEEILTGNVGDSYDALTKQIIANAKAKAFSDEITLNSTNLRALEKQQLDTANQILAKRVELENAKRVSTQSAQKVAGQLAATDLNVVGIQSQLNDLIQTQIKSIDESNKIKKTNLELDVLINKELQNGAVFTSKNTEENKKLTRSYEDLSKITQSLTFASLERGGSFFEDVEKQLKSLESGVATTRGIYQENISAIAQSNKALNQALDGSGISVEQFYAAIANGAAEGFSSLNQFVQSLSTTQQFINGAFDVLEKGIENTIGDVAFAIGDALASGGNVLQAGGAALLEGIAGIMNQLGQMAIEAGFTILAIKKSLESLNPYVAIAAGIALIALAGAVSSKAKKISKSGGGGGGGGGGGSSVGSSGVGGGTSFAGGGQGALFQQNKDLNGELVVRGQDLVYVFSQANNNINKG